MAAHTNTDSSAIPASGILAGNKIDSISSTHINVIDAFKQTEATRNAARQKNHHDYYLNDTLGRIYVTLSVLIFIFSSFVPIVPILLLYSIWFPMPFLKGLKMLSPDRPTLWASCFAGLSILSTLWSDYPLKSFYMGTALLSTVLCTIIINRTVRIKPFLEGLLIGIGVSMALTLQNGTYGADVFSDSYALIGYFGSKNIVGAIAAFGIITSVGFIFLEKISWRILLVCAPTFILCLICLYMSRSATSLVAVTLSLAAMLWATIMTRIPRSLKLIIISASLLVAMFFAAGIAVDGGKLLLGALGKDSTLTGRTQLWSEGYKIGWERPVLGHGFSAFWIQGQAQAERLWYQFEIPSRGGFHFHNTYIQIFVDLGLCGVILVAMQILGTFLSCVFFALSGYKRAEATLLLGISVMFLIRSFVEIDIIGVFSLSAFLFYSIALRLDQFRHSVREQENAPNVAAEPVPLI